MDIKAFKMDGLGNDFVIIDNRQKVTDLSKEQIIKICETYTQQTVIKIDLCMSGLIDTQTCINL